jgi:hypothetical protein
VPRGVGNLYEWAWLAREAKDGALPCWNLGGSLECVEWSSVVGAGAGAWVCWAWAWVRAGLAGLPSRG